MAHTPGPWTVPVRQRFAVSAPDGRILGYFNCLRPDELAPGYWRNWPSSYLEADANAKLAAAAPDLLAALEAVEWVPMEYRESCPWCHADPGSGGHAPDCQRQAAIAKAKGETK
jgi:hypothetical protein